MTRQEARALIGNQPKWALRNMARALQMLTRLNDQDDWNRLEALRALGYKVTVEIPGVADKAKRAKAWKHAQASHKARLARAGQACAREYIARHGAP